MFFLLERLHHQLSGGEQPPLSYPCPSDSLQCSPGCTSQLESSLSTLLLMVAVKALISPYSADRQMQRSARWQAANRRSLRAGRGPLTWAGDSETEKDVNSSLYVSVCDSEGWEFLWRERKYTFLRWSLIQRRRFSETEIAAQWKMSQHLWHSQPLLLWLIFFCHCSTFMRMEAEVLFHQFSTEGAFYCVINFNLWVLNGWAGIYEY